MKKIITFVTTLILLILPIAVKADEVSTLNLVDTLAAESIDFDSTNYTESTDKINIYMFRGQGCSHCQEFLKYLASIVPNYGKYFNLVSYEVWNNKANESVRSDVADFLDEDEKGVPFIVIGDKKFVGYASSYDADIISAITTLYNSDDRYDVFTEMSKTTTDVDSDAVNKAYKNTITWMVIINVMVFVAYSIKSNKDKNEILAKIK